MLTDNICADCFCENAVRQINEINIIADINLKAVYSINYSKSRLINPIGAGCCSQFYTRRDLSKEFL
jgi:hypothetical protein